MEYNSLEHDESSIFFEKDPALRSLLRSKTPVWLNVARTSQSSKSEICGSECELQGIRWASILGSSAQSGFKVIFQRIDNFDVMNPSLSNYVSLLHKKIMGEKVFDTKILNGDNLSPKYFTHCTKNMSGSFSVMGVNFAYYKTKVSTKLPNKYTGSQVHQYILNVDGGHILFNGVPVNINSDLEPIVTNKKQNRLTTFTLPPRSVGFWVFPLANLKQCSTTSDVKKDFHSDLENGSRTASENLLHELISEVIQNDSARNEIKRSKRHSIIKKDSNHMNRHKRSADPGYKTRRAVNLFKKFNGEATKRNIGVFGRPRHRVTRQINNMNYNNNINYNERFSKLFKTFELPRVKKFNMAKFWNLPHSTQNNIPNGAAIPPVVSTIHDVYRVDPSEQIFKSAENSELPTGDVFFEVGEERNMDYVEFDDKSENFRNNRQRNQHRMETEKFVDFDVNDVPVVPGPTYELFNEAIERKRATPAMPQYSGELWESDAYQQPPSPQATYELRHSVDDSNNHEGTMSIVQELPPTFRQNQEILNQAKSNLKTIYVSEGDNMPSNKLMPIRHFDLDDDGFFVTRRKRRSINAELNDEIENKLKNLKKAGEHKGEEVEEYIDFLNKNGSKINLLERITKIIESIEKIDDIGKHNNIEKLNSDIKDLENFLFRKNSKFGVLIPKNRVTQKEVRRKCKILSVNLEQQCLKENDFYPSRLINRDANSDHKAKKVSTLKNAFPAKKSDNINRIRRDAVYLPSSWEDDDVRNNMIIKEMYTANEFNDFVPSISFKTPVSFVVQPKEEKKDYIGKVSVLQNLPERFVQNSDMQVIEQPEQPLVDTSFETKIIKENIDGEAKEYPTPKFMKKITRSVSDWMNIVEKHVSGWWNILS